MKYSILFLFAIVNILPQNERFQLVTPWPPQSPSDWSVTLWPPQSPSDWSVTLWPPQSPGDWSVTLWPPQSPSDWSVTLWPPPSPGDWSVTPWPPPSPGYWPVIPWRPQSRDYNKQNGTCAQPEIPEVMNPKQAESLVQFLTDLIKEDLLEYELIREKTENENFSPAKATLIGNESINFSPAKATLMENEREKYKIYDQEIEKEKEMFLSSLNQETLLCVGSLHAAKKPTQHIVAVAIGEFVIYCYPQPLNENQRNEICECDLNGDISFIYDEIILQLEQQLQEIKEK